MAKKQRASKPRPARTSKPASATFGPRTDAAPSANAQTGPEPELRRTALRFILRASIGMGVLYGLYYFPYQESWPAHALSSLLAAQAQAAAWLIGCFEAGVHADSGLIQGRFPMRVVKACSSLDAQALFLATVLAFPSVLRSKLIGALVGVVLLTALNIVRIASLYFVGLYAPGWFDMVHEELFPLLLVAAACAAFAGWAIWAQRKSPVLTTHA